MNTNHESLFYNEKRSLFSLVVSYLVTVCVTLLGVFLLYKESPDKAEIIQRVTSMLQMRTQHDVYSLVYNVFLFIVIMPIAIRMSISKLSIRFPSTVLSLEFKLQRVTHEFGKRTALRSLMFSVVYILGAMVIVNIFDKYFLFDFAHPGDTFLNLLHGGGILFAYSMLLYEGFKLFGYKIDQEGFIELLYVCVFDPYRCIFSKSEAGLLGVLLYSLMSILIVCFMILLSDWFKYSLFAYLVTHIYFLLMYYVQVSLFVHVELYEHYKKYL